MDHMNDYTFEVKIKNSSA